MIALSVLLQHRGTFVLGGASGVVKPHKATILKAAAAAAAKNSRRSQRQAVGSKTNTLQRKASAKPPSSGKQKKKILKGQKHVDLSVEVTAQDFDQRLMEVRVGWCMQRAPAVMAVTVTVIAVTTMIA